MVVKVGVVVVVVVLLLVVVVKVVVVGDDGDVPVTVKYRKISFSFYST